jgi:HEAT repeat protein
MNRLRWIPLVATVALGTVGAQTPASTAFDGIPLRTWVAKVLDDSSLFRRNRAAAAIRRAPRAFRREFVRSIAPSLESGTADRRRRAIDAIGTVVNEGQFGQILEERGPDLVAAVPMLLRIADDPKDDNRRRAWFLLERTDSVTRRRALPLARTGIADPDPGVRWQAVRFLTTVRDSTDFLRVLAATRDSSASVRETALLAVSRWQPRRGVSAYMNALADAAGEVREAALIGLGRAGPAAYTAVQPLTRLLGDSSATHAVRANAAWALSLIIPRYDQENFLQVEVSDDHMGIRSDGLGPYIHGSDSVSVTKAASLNLGLDGPRGDGRATNLKMVRPLRRSLLFDLSRPVASSGARPLGLIRDNEAISHMAFTHLHEQSMVSITRLEPNDSLTPVERVEFQFRINGAAHLLQMGEWTQGEFNRSVPRVDGNGTTTARVAHPDAGSWTVFAPEGSVARLWDLSDPQSPVDRGLYIVPFKFRWSLMDLP